MKPVVTDWTTSINCVRFVARNGTTIRLTDYPQDISMNGVTYLSDAGYEFTGVDYMTSTTPGSVDLSGILVLFDVDDIEAGVWDLASVYMFATSWLEPIEDEEPLAKGFFGKAALQDERFKVQLMTLIDAANQSFGETHTALCPKRYGGTEYAGCKDEVVTATGTLTNVNSTVIFRDSTRTEADDFWGAGLLEFLTGPNTGLPAKEVKSYDPDGSFEIVEPFHYTVSVGDQYRLSRGCRKRLEDCIARDNILNFGGDPFIPTEKESNAFGDN